VPVEKVSNLIVFSPPKAAPGISSLQLVPQPSMSGLGEPVRRLKQGLFIESSRTHHTSQNIGNAQREPCAPTH